MIGRIVRPVVVPLLLLLGACSDGAGDAGGSQSRSVAESEGPGVTAAAQAVVADPLQAEILKDEQVTPSEMERALLAVVSCVTEQGFEAELESFDEDGYEFFVGAAPDGSTEASGAALDQCQARFLSEVAEPYRLQNGPSQQDVDAEHEMIRDCLRAKGYDVDGLDVVEMSRLAENGDFIACDPDT